MCDLDSFHLLTVDGQMRVLERMLADREADKQARAQRFAKPLSPLATATGLPPVLSPERAVASTSSETSS